MKKLAIRRGEVWWVRQVPYASRQEAGGRLAGCQEGGKEGKMQKVFFNWQHLPALFKLFLEEKIINGNISFGFLRSPAHNGKVCTF